MNSEHCTQRAKLDGPGADSPQLLSLLALAAGAVMMPQTSEADVIYTNLTSPTVVSDTLSFIIDNLPGTARFGFAAHTHIKSIFTSSRWITVAEQTGYVNLKTQAGFALPVSAGRVWGTIAGFANLAGGVASWTETSAFGRFYRPPGFTDKYYAFQFKDSTSGNAFRYGWVKVDLANSQNNSSGPQLTIYSWAYDTTGAQLAMGSTGVPEPSSGALLALGALTLGAKGLRNWRRNRLAA